MTDLQSLHCALSEAESGSRELDAGIAWHVDGHSGATIDALRDGSPNADALVPRYTTSIDAITSLIERKLPGWSWAISSDYHPEELGAPPETIRRATLTAPLNGGEWDAEYVNGSPALALAASLVSALIAQESEK
ncbi:hypothetical protein [Oceanicaulis sp.]|uniref:hypothetical protein n=1 Tax=Oceanicaulis sp. TaxID=1924941 RepID=UPI0025FE477B|nr:hypothetical protein [Oceanicaulis sp.]|tara:strand:- start:2338 stop:2742 length:405 start_codon:yes stop_codon:yes gene_type:complete